MSLFQNLIITGRPACGKSEFIDFMKKIPLEQRIEKYCIGKFEEIDDFPWLWELCEEDDRREKEGLKRLCTESVPEGFNVIEQGLRGRLIEKMNEVIIKKYLKRPEFYDEGTLMIEFARGKTDGFRNSLNNLSKEVLEVSAILHILVTFEESYRKNNARYEKGLESSILFHKVPDKDMFGFFKENDWLELTENRPDGYLMINDVKVPFLTMNNEPELTDPEGLEKRYSLALKKLMQLYQNRR